MQPARKLSAELHHLGLVTARPLGQNKDTRLLAAVMISTALPTTARSSAVVR